MTDGKLRILMLAPTPFFSDRGCHVRIYEEARTLIGRGHEVRVVTYHLGRDMPGISTRRIPSVPWYRKLAAGPSWHKPYLDILLFCIAVSEVRRFRPDLLYAHLHEGAFLGVFLKKLFRVPLLFDCQGSLTTEIVDHNFVRPGSLPYCLFQRIEGFVNARADLILTSSGPAASDLREQWAVPEGRVRSLMDGVDTEEFQHFESEAVNRELNLPAGVPVAVFLGVLNRYQGIDILLEVVKIIRDRGVPLHFLIMGFPHDHYQRRAVAEGLSERITFTGRIDYRDAPRLLAAGDVAVSPKVSLSEANGKLFNYMACGIPVLAFDTPINREILGDAGVYARFGDAADFAARLEELLLHEGLRRELAEKVRNKAVVEHSWEARGRELEQACLHAVL